MRFMVKQILRGGKERRSESRGKAKKARGVINSSRRGCVIHLLFPSWDREPSPVPHVPYVTGQFYQPPNQAAWVFPFVIGFSALRNRAWFLRPFSGAYPFFFRINRPLSHTDVFCVPARVFTWKGREHLPVSREMRRCLWANCTTAS